MAMGPSATQTPYLVPTAAGVEFTSILSARRIAPSRGFDSSSCLAAYSDVATAGLDPLQHYLQFGAFEGRSTFADGLF